MIARDQYTVARGAAVRHRGLAQPEVSEGNYWYRNQLHLAAPSYLAKVDELFGPARARDSGTD